MFTSTTLKRLQRCIGKQTEVIESKFTFFLHSVVFVVSEIQCETYSNIMGYGCIVKVATTT